MGVSDEGRVSISRTPLSARSFHLARPAARIAGHRAIDRRRAAETQIALSAGIALASISILTRMNRAVGRARDFDDVEHLQMIRAGQKAP
jgi:hypothetical protein